MLSAASALAAPLLAIVTNTVDDGGGGTVGLYTSLALDAAGNPVISYYDGSNTDLKLAHCSDANCAGATLTTVDGAVGNAGHYTSLALDAAGNPVISYYTSSTGALRLAHCNDPDCASATINTVDPCCVGHWTSLALDGAGNPVISYLDFGGTGALRLAHCNDPDCASATITTVDSGGVGEYTSLALDAAGNPVISYYDGGNGTLKLAHCDDAFCASATINTVDPGGNVGASYTSLALDAAGNPVISYYDSGNQALKLAHCSDANCASATITTVDSGGVGEYTSLALDGAGNPVISYFDQSNGALKLAHCNDPDCVSATIDTVDSGGVGQYTSLALDGAGNPVISYYDSGNSDLKLARIESTDTGAAVGSDGGEGAQQTCSQEVNSSGATVLACGRIRVSIPASAIQTGESGCRIVIKKVGDSGVYGFTLDDVVWDVRVICDGGEVNIFFAPISVCIRPLDGVVNDKRVFHRHNNAGSFSGLARTYDIEGFVCSHTRVLSLFTLGAFALPATGFAPNVQADLGVPVSYVSTDLTLDLPRLDVHLPIVGVPQGINGWDVSWLGSSAGFLQGTAFPTFAGNTVITAHVWGSDNQPGPFAELESLRHGDRFMISAWGSTYTYEVRSNTLFNPTAISPLGHEVYDWVTLITCEGFDEASGEYAFRRVVRAVLVSVD